MKHLNILYYISSHGYGHAARAGQVIRELVKEHTVYVKSTAPKWLFHQVIGTDPFLFPQTFDTGCLQFNNMDVDIETTLGAYKRQSQANKQSLDSELFFIRDKNIELIVSDIPSFPFLIAKKASIPSVFIGNFTWMGIYSFFLKDGFHPIITELREQYGMADLSLITPLAMDMPELNNQKKINLIARLGNNIRDRLNHDFDIPKANKLVFFYAGNRGVERIHPELIGKIDEHTFISFCPLDSQPANYILLKSVGYAHEDIMASSDIALIKPGYGMVSEALVNNVPIIYPPREDFAEYHAFVKEFEISGGTRLISRDDFSMGNWHATLLSIEGKKYRKNYSSNGAKECKRIVENLL